MMNLLQANLAGTSEDESSSFKSRCDHNPGERIMGKKLVGVFNREMSDEEFETLQRVCKDCRVRPADEEKYDILLWWLSATDPTISHCDPYVYEFQDGPSSCWLFIPDAKLIAAFQFKQYDLARLESLKERAQALRHIDQAILDIREEVDIHRAKMKSLTGVSPSLVSKGVFRKFCDQLFTDQDHVYEAAKKLCEDRRYRFQVKSEP